MTALRGKMTFGRDMESTIPALARTLFVAIDVPRENVFQVIKPIRRNKG